MTHYAQLNDSVGPGQIEIYIIGHLAVKLVIEFTTSLDELVSRYFCVILSAVK